MFADEALIHRKGCAYGSLSTVGQYTVKGEERRMQNDLKSGSSASEFLVHGKVIRRIHRRIIDIQNSGTRTNVNVLSSNQPAGLESTKGNMEDLASPNGVFKNRTSEARDEP